MASENSPDMARRQLRITVWEEEQFELPLKDLTAALERSVDPWTLEAVGAADDPARFRVEPDSEPLPDSLMLP